MDWSDRLASTSDAVLGRFGLPAAVVGLIHDGGSTVHVHGRLANGGPATIDTRFDLASITKLLTATQIMRLVQRGAVDLHADVTTLVPELGRLADEAGGAMTVHRLLTHTSGLVGDFLVDTGDDDDAISRFVAQVAVQGLLHRPGTITSYSNAGYSTAGRLAEILLGATWESTIEQEVFAPIGMDETTVGAGTGQDVRAHGHLRLADGATVPGAMWPPWRSCAPAGSRTWSTIRDVLLFLQVHLDGGAAATDPYFLTGAAVRQMQVPEPCATPHPQRGALAPGIGWRLARWDGRMVLSHSGGGANRVLLVPDVGVGVVLLSNAPGGAAAHDVLCSKLLPELADLTPPTGELPPFDGGPDRGELEPLLGSYTHADRVLEVARDAAGLVLRHGGTQVALREVGDDAWATPSGSVVTFLAEPEVDSSEIASQIASRRAYRRPPTHLHNGLHAHRRAADRP